MNHTLKILFFLCIQCSLHASAQIVAGFTASVTSGCAPLIVNFTNTSTGATAYSWNLGNTNNSYFTNASTSYGTPGTYTVTLTATNGSNSDSISQQIIVYPPPVVSFSASDTLVCPGVQILFTNNTSMGSAGAGTYYWDFGDGNSSTSQSPPHTYQTPGYYTVTLTATNSDGCSASLAQNALIHIRNTPVPQFSLSSGAFCALPAVVSINDQTTGAGPLNYTWRFGDGGTSTLANPTHSYSSAGTYTVTEVVTDVNGCTDSLGNTTNIALNGLSGSFVSPDSVCVNSAVTFVNTTTAPFISNYWNYGNGVSYAGNNPGTVYYTPGTYTVMLVMYDGNCHDTITHNILVKAGPVVTTTLPPKMLCPSPLTLPFSATSAPGTTYKWSFGDGDSATGSSVSHLYVKDTFFLVTLQATNFCTTTLLDTLNIVGFAAIDTLTPGSGCMPLAAHFNFSAWTAPPPLGSPYPYAIISKQFFFGDGSPGITGPFANHTYTTTGEFNAFVVITFGNGCVDTSYAGIGVGQAPVLDTFSVSPTHLCRHDTATFRGRGTGIGPLLYIYSYVPNSPDSSVGGDYDTVDKFQFSKPGYFRTSLTIYNYGCPSSTSAPIYVTVDSPAARTGGALYSCDSPLYVKFGDSSIGATSRLWVFGDGTTDTAATPIHYFSPGSHVPLLTVSNINSGCRDTATVPVYTYLFRPIISAPDTAMCKNGHLLLTALYTGGPPPVSYSWFFNNHYSGDSATFMLLATTTGYDTVRLVDLDSHRCIDVAEQTIFVSQPIAGFSASPTQACVPSTVIFTDTTHDTPGAYIVSRAWTYGDATNNTVSTTTSAHQYNAVGNFSIKEIVTDNNGCTDSVYKSNYIHTHSPTANFTVANTIHCIGDPISFVNTGTAGLQTSYWTFGDGSSSYAAAPVHSYGATGTYTVTFAIVDSTGCTDTLVRSAYISIVKPHAAFTVNDSTGVCAPLVVNFTNASTNASTYAWNFGNTNTSVATNPSNSYSIPGNYAIRLVVTDAHGCTDTAYGHASLYGYSGTFSYTPLAGCPPLNVNFTASITNIPSITWDFSDGTVAGPSASNTISHTYSSPGKYVPRVILGDSAGCHTSITGTDTIRIDKVTAGFKETASICIYDTVHFADTSSGLFSALSGWYWMLGDGASTFAHDPTHTYHTAGNFSVTLIATDAAGCKDTVTNTILIHPLPVISATGDTSICPGDSALVTGSGGVSYVWSPAATVHCTSCNPTFAAAVVPTTYVVVGTDAFGCRNKDSVKIGSKYKTVSHVGPGGQICLGRSISLSDSGAQSYTWYPQSGLSDSHSQFPVATPTGSTTYLAIAKTASCIPDTNYVNVTVNPLPVVHAQGNGTVLAGDKVNLQAYGPDIVYFTWDHADLLSCDSCTNPIATMQQSTWFTVTATNEYGCQDTAGVLVSVLCDKSQVFIPNTFTPNGDGQNDVFYPRGIGIRVVRSFRIYNRWGELVFQRNNINLNDEGNGWDGTFNGARPVPDTYVYALDAICDDGQPIDWKGDVTLIR